MSEQSEVVHIDIYSDVICPWCYVGKRRLERALALLHGAVQAQVRWRPFQLNPTMPKEGIDRKAYLEAKFGRMSIVEEMEHRLLEAGRIERISFVFQKMAVTPNTFLAHRLIWYAGQQGCQNEIVNQLFKGYFEEGLDIGSAPVLAELADRAGLHAGQFLTSEEGVVEVKAEELGGHKLGIRAVPYFMFNKADSISGAQPVEVFVSAFEKIRIGPSVADRL